MGFDTRTGGLATMDVGADLQFPIYSQLGVVVHDLETWKNAGGDDQDPLNDNIAMAADTAEVAEEQWLDSNSLSLMINRYNGTLIRGE
jgi:hypothetical protein